MGRFFSRRPLCTFEDCAPPCHGPNKKHPRRLFLFREEAAGVLLFCVVFCVLGLVEHILQAFEEALALTDYKAPELRQELADYGAALPHDLDSSAMKKLPAKKIVTG